MTVFSKRLHDLREQNGLSMYALAQKIGVSDAAICKWENDTNEPKASYIAILADFFEVSTDYLLGLENDFGAKKYSTPLQKNVELSSEELHLLESFRKLNTKNRMHVVAYAEIRLEEQGPAGAVARNR